MNLPEFGKEELTDDSLRIPAFFYGGMDWFDGHFDFRRIFPGVGQLHVISVLAEKYFGIADITGAYVAGVILCNLADRD